MQAEFVSGLELNRSIYEFKESKRLRKTLGFNPHADREYVKIEYPNKKLDFDLTMKTGEIHYLPPLVTIVNDSGLIRSEYQKIKRGT